MPIRRRKPDRMAPAADDGEAGDPDAAARDAAAKAKAGSARLRLALLRYGAKHGLPNLSPRQCLAALRQARGGQRAGRRTAGRPQAAPSRFRGHGGAPGAAGDREGRGHGSRR